MAKIMMEKPANSNAVLNGIEASVYDLQAAAKLAIEACERLQGNIKALDEQMALMDANFKNYENGLSDLDHRLSRQTELSDRLREIMED